ncbi:glycosyl transferase family 1 [Pseudoduganella flava]|uniref:Glycosyl transferase family 1 n=1 Tax=Pseudoduganella flava TaxID=871742 RepID=A0A562PVD7_9BURK|nr:glycosyltransferase family 1 protein [Pseudoduganella flava]QGZ39529.1 glycosyltransferase [Pseudoduganella flava]TWI48422.1 glycosyl transferase family 1 [Pseudoduganella flava]
MRTEPMRSRQLLVDLSMLVQHDARSGIQRVVRSVFAALHAAPPPGWRVAAVHDAGGYYVYSRSHTDGTPAGDDPPIAVDAGDIFLGLDLAPEHIVRNQAVLADLRQHGVRIHFVVYDLVPLLLPELFPPGLPEAFRRWFDAAASVADGFVCISHAVADDVLAQLEAAPPRRTGLLRIGCFHLGADVAASQPSSGETPGEAGVLAALAARPTVLMVGTLEPRKMHGQALDALEECWRRGEDVNFVVVGKAGWLLDRLAARLRNHAECGHRLFWLEQASDETLLRLYEGSSVLLANSAAEGFGLPLIEAARHGLPVLARDLPVFREVAGSHATYFTADNGSQLADALQQWLAAYRTGAAIPSVGMPYLDWSASTAQLLRVILDGCWDRTAPARLP